MEELRFGGTALNRQVDILIEKVFIEESLCKFLDLLQAQFGAATMLQINLTDQKRQTVVQSWVDVH